MGKELAKDRELLIVWSAIGEYNQAISKQVVNMYWPKIVSQLRNTVCLVKNDAS